MSAAPPLPSATGLLLAAGASRRFGDANKLLAPLAGRPLVAAAAEAMRALPLDRRIAVISDARLIPLLDGFHIVQISQGQQSDSLRAGLAAAADPARLLIALGDMPLVTTAHLAAILATCTDDLPAASRNQDSGPMPPACFPRSWLDRLGALTGDQGAGRLIRDLPDAQLITARDLLSDIDTREDLARLNP